MRCFRCNFSYAGKAAIILFVWMSSLFLLPDAGWVQDNQKENADSQPIHITSDLLTTDSQAGFVEFSGNVRVTQGTTVILSDRLKVFYKEDADTTQKISGGEGAVEKIVASGNVQIDFDDKKAVSNKAEYHTDTQMLVLSGPDSKVTTANESVSGAKITLYRSDGRIKVESGEGKRVEAVFNDMGNVKKK